MNFDILYVRTIGQCSKTKSALNFDLDLLTFRITREQLLIKCGITTAELPHTNSLTKALRSKRREMFLSILKFDYSLQHIKSQMITGRMDYFFSLTNLPYSMLWGYGNTSLPFPSRNIPMVWYIGDL